MTPPPCPSCLADDGTPGAVLCREECDEYPPAVRLICAACGHGFAGTDSEFEQAQAADAARWTHPRDMPEPPAGCEMGGVGCCKACSAPPGYHARWCAMRAASDREIARLRGAVST